MSQAYSDGRHSGWLARVMGEPMPAFILTGHDDFSQGYRDAFCEPLSDAKDGAE